MYLLLCRPIVIVPQNMLSARECRIVQVRPTQQDVSIKLKKGEIVIFPPYWTHPYKIRTTDSNSVTYILKTWMFGE